MNYNPALIFCGVGSLPEMAKKRRRGRVKSIILERGEEES